MTEDQPEQKTIAIFLDTPHNGQITGQMRLPETEGFFMVSQA
jgi:hypothetical protein